ncbi:MAG: hypothetical protein ACREEK_25345 [Bradyrhizobium sp.]
MSEESGKQRRRTRLGFQQRMQFAKIALPQRYCATPHPPLQMEKSLPRTCGILAIKKNNSTKRISIQFKIDAYVSNSSEPNRITTLPLQRRRATNPAPASRPAGADVRLHCGAAHQGQAS